MKNKKENKKKIEEEINEEIEDNNEEQINNSEIELLGNRIKELENNLLRNQAELINYKKRRDEEVSRLLKYKDEELIKQILPIIDNFERAINMDDDNLDDEVSKFLSGFKMIYGNLLNILANLEVKEIEALHTKFDPTYHQAVLQEHDDNLEEGIIIDVMQKGYMYKDKVIRPSMVKVNN